MIKDKDLKGMILQMNVQVISAQEMGEPYTKISSVIKNRDRVVITNNEGISESIIINIAEYEAIKEAAWERYVLNALAEVEAVKDDPSTWLSLDEFWQD